MGKTKNDVERMYRNMNKLIYYKLSPKIVQVNTSVTFNVAARFEGYALDGEYSVCIIPYMEYDYNCNEKTYNNEIRVTAANNELNFEYKFEKEQQYYMIINKIEEDGTRLLLIHDSIYALEEDLYVLKPLKGDLHTHTVYSDGYITPQLIVATAKKCGLDFLAVTDHNGYEGSVATEEECRKLGNPVTIIRGEEISSEFSPMHVLAIGTKEKIAPYEYSQEIFNEPEVIAELDTTTNINCDKKAFVGTQRLFRKIKELGGISFICHPMWKPLSPHKERMDTPISLILELCKNKEFDGMEVVAGSPFGEKHATNIQELIARETNVSFDKMPIIGTTDSHTAIVDRIFGKHYTIAFAKSESYENIVDAIRNCMVVAVDGEDEEQPLLYGNLRLCLYGYFLCSTYFRERDYFAVADGLKLLDDIKLR